jgi:PAS domain-containing protein
MIPPPTHPSRWSSLYNRNSAWRSVSFRLIFSPFFFLFHRAATTSADTVTSAELITLYAPAERAPDAELQRQAELFADPLQVACLDAVPDIVTILNQQRQIVFANRSLVESLGLEHREEVYGQRPGEALGCEHSFAMKAGCGTSEFCRDCGAVHAILAGLEGKREVQECRITRSDSGEALDLRVWTTPLQVDGEPFTFFTLADIGHEKRRRVLERIFFHDILNTAGGLKGFVELLQESDPDELDELTDIVHRLSRELIEEIQGQKTLSAAESGDLEAESTPIRSLELLQDVLDLYRNHEVAENRHLRLDANIPNIPFISDPGLLRRVIGNLVKNGLEACAPGSTITLGCTKREGRIEFRVHNPGVIPRSVQLQIFQRSFSTKGAGRGLGTYSIRLLTEKYLKGNVSFTTSPEEGTTFTVSYPLFL